MKKSVLCLVLACISRLLFANDYEPAKINPSENDRAGLYFDTVEKGQGVTAVVLEEVPNNLILASAEKKKFHITDLTYTVVIQVIDANGVEGEHYSAVKNAKPVAIKKINKQIKKHRLDFTTLQAALNSDVDMDVNVYGTRDFKNVDDTCTLRCFFVYNITVKVSGTEVPMQIFIEYTEDASKLYQ
ncbi:MAG: hypothetical protein J5930_04090 [Treponema sp.]|nr:hypothetical protein [Treponema sp.]